MKKFIAIVMALALASTMLFAAEAKAPDTTAPAASTVTAKAVVKAKKAKRAKKVKAVATPVAEATTVPAAK